MRKTYGVPGMMEWTVNLRAGKSTVRVNFTGGTQTGYGVTPATFSTENEVVMYLIENSDWFRQGRIKDLTPKRRK